MLADQPHERTLGLDDYQRGFVWEPRRARQLVADLAEYAARFSTDVPGSGGESGYGARAPGHAYYMGTVLLHRTRDDQEVTGDESPPVTHYVIDGQQRLAALSLLWGALNHGEHGSSPPGSVPAGIRFKYYQQGSLEHLKRAYQAVKAELEQHLEGKGARHRDLLEAIGPFSRIALTIVETDTEDEAFAFFDSQNHRGVPLETTDLLKAHHLRAIRVHSHGAPEERPLLDALERDNARRWERLQQAAGGIGANHAATDFASRLFSRYLWRGRCWSGWSSEDHGRRTLLAEFRDEAYPPQELINRLAGKPPEVTAHHEYHRPRGGIDQVPCFPSSTRMFHPAVRWSRRSQSWEVDLRLPHQSAEPTRLPFTLRQPLSEGAGFFLYAERYGALLRELEAKPKTANGDADEWDRFRHFYHSVVRGALSGYLCQPFLLATLLYVDRFDDCRLLEFALWLDHAIGTERVRKRAIHEASVRGVLGGHSHSRWPNLLDLIAHSAIPDTVIRTLRELPGVDEAYERFDAEGHQGGRGAQVQNAYAHALRNYFDRDEQEPLAGKREWIHRKLNTLAQPEPSVGEAS